MFTLTMEFDDNFEYNGRFFSVRLAFDNILRLLELLQDAAFADAEKIEIALEMLIDQYHLISGETIETKFNLFKFVLKEFLEIDLEQEPATENPPAEQEAAEEETPQKTYCFTQDAGIIYASFFRAYQMDLFEQRGKLHWKKFLQLLLHLDDKSKFKEVINIRTMKLPKADKYNAQYRSEIRKMKRIYALKDSRPESEQAKAIEKQLDGLAEKLQKL